ncbi:MAG: YidH family protein [Gammaproteobacteria bacterium]
MPIADADPRVFFAAERTLLAWLRTGLTIIAIGVVLARFGLFLELIAAQAPAAARAGTGGSAVFGIAFVLLGALAIVAAVIQHRRFVATLAASDLPAQYSRAFAVGLSLAVAALGFALAAWLIYELR